MTDQQPLVGVLIGPDESPDIRTDQDSPPRGTRERERERERKDNAVPLLELRLEVSVGKLEIELIEEEA